MSQISNYSVSGGGGAGTVTSISAGTGITLTPNPITTTGTVALTIPVVISSGGTNAITMTNTFGVNYFDGTSIVTTTVGNAAQVLTSNGVGVAPTFQNAAASSISITGNSGGALVGNAFTFTGGTTGLLFSGAGTTETLTGTLAIANGGTNATSMTNTFGVNYFDGTRLVTTTVGASTQVLTSNGVGVAPTFQAIPASTSVNTLTGNSGVATAAANNINIVTANTTVKFTGAAATITQDFGLSNILLGSNGAITTGIGNVSLGQGSAALVDACKYTVAIGLSTLPILAGGVGVSENNTFVGAGGGTLLTRGISNTGLGFGVLGNLATGSNNLALGNTSGFNLNGAESSNIMIKNQGVIGDNNTIRIGATGTGTDQQNKCFIAGITTVNVGSVASVVSISGDQLGSTTITAGTGITITPTANVITIAATGITFTWSVITADQTAAVNNGYICNKGSALLLALPTTSLVGAILEVTGINTALGWKVTQAANQIIHLGTSDTTTGVTGFIQSSATRDSVRMVCIVANLEWNVLSVVGNITVN